ncbi:hypothetical protein EZV73_05205 [Acidaminobacter sp. JC074]|uniref:M14 family metallopeptidase n=1 Tax=Acidaminobacter sp. JC074 TaxID=2530199 RepID=UPI001F10C330|nr:M14 family metallopeptidase [Acidaminobacter sp. JC074]MCH4886953.1 hypothetical protein [Acidaminobacter sp. JC074]
MTLDKLFTSEGILKEDKLISGMSGPVVIEELNKSTALFALNFIARCAYESVGFDLDNLVIGDYNKDKMHIRCVKSDRLASTEVHLISNNVYFEVKYGSDQALEKSINYICGRLPYIWSIDDFAPKLDQLATNHIVLDSDYQGIMKAYVNDALDIDWKRFSMLASIETNNQFFQNPNKIQASQEETFASSEVDKKRDLTDLFSVGGLYESEDSFFPTSSAYKVLVPEQVNEALIRAMSSFVSRFALDCLSLSMPLVVDIHSGPSIQFNDKAQDNKIYFENGDLIIESKDIEDFTKNLVLKYPWYKRRPINDVKNLENFVNEFLRSENTHGQLIDVLGKDRVTELRVENLSDANVERLSDDLPELKIGEYREDQIVWSDERIFEWEVDVFKKILLENLSKCQPDDSVEIRGCLSESPQILDELASYIGDECNMREVKLDSCTLLSSYKQGFHWLKSLLPRLKEIDADKVVIKFKPFLQEGQTEWFDEDSAKPKYNVERADDDAWFDLPIRWLQELYPIDDLIASDLEISRNRVIFEDDSNLEYTYQVLAFKDEQVVYEDVYDVHYSERNYLDRYPKVGKVHPSTGFIEIKINSKVICLERINTDLENIWSYYQKEVLDKVTNIALEEGRTLTHETQPIFKTLRLEIHVSEPDYSLPTRKDLISSIDAFHEDIYFVGLDYFKILGEREFNEVINEPGLILPVIKKSDGPPKVKVTLVKELSKTPYKVRKDQIEYFETAEQQEIVALTYDKGKWFGEFKINQDQLKKFETLKGAINKGYLRLNSPLNLRLVGGDVLDIEGQVKECFIEEVELKADEVIGYEDYLGLIKNLEKKDYVNTYLGSKSYQNREIHVVEMLDYSQADLVSRHKLINEKPVYLINNRHHANEVSSTNAAFMTIHELLKEENAKYLDALNIVFIPFENVDGGAIHYELQKDNPEWKLHVARFNSVGKEFAYDYFNDETKYTEALAYTRTWRRWLPDVVVDNHGVPSHEWDQQFSGYTSPWFKGFWLPRALYYGYFWHLSKINYPEHFKLYEGLQDVISETFAKDQYMSKWNDDWQDRFEKYAHKWLPKMFPANYYKKLIYYWMEYEASKDAWHAFSRYPQITSLEWTTEVSDETAQGKYLELCSKSHMMSNLATMDYLMTLKVEKENLSSDKNGIILKTLRKRPLGRKG